MAKMSFTVTQWQLSDPVRHLYRAVLAAEIKDNNNQPLGGQVSITAPERESIDIQVNPAKGTGTGELLFISKADAVVLVGESIVQGQLLTARQQIALKPKTPKLIPDRVSVNAVGNNGQYIIFTNVLDKDNTAVAGVPVRIINEKNRREEDAGQTDQNGSFSSKEITFPERECSFLVIAGGLDPIQLKLEGPSRWKKYKKPNIPKAEFQKGLWHAIKVGWKTEPAG
jgi:hypothetical protein